MKTVEIIKVGKSRKSNSYWGMLQTQTPEGFLMNVFVRNINPLEVGEQEIPVEVLANAGYTV